MWRGRGQFSPFVYGDNTWKLNSPSHDIIVNTLMNVFLCYFGSLWGGIGEPKLEPNISLKRYHTKCNIHIHFIISMLPSSAQASSST